LFFHQEKSGNWEVYITDKNGKNEKNITNDRASDIEPIFSPDGTKVLFTSYNNGDPGIFSIDLNTNNKTKLNTEESDIFQKLKFSPDGSKLIFTRSNNNFEELYIVNSDGSNMKKNSFK
jgi:TolB protein